MKRAALIVMGVLTLGSTGRTETSAPAQDVPAYLDQLQIKLDHAAQRANQPSASGSSVVSLRGSKQEPLSKQLYWKGKTMDVAVSPDEVKMFRTAIEQAKAGDTPQASATLKSFLDKYPTSGLKGDAEDTLQLLASVPAAPVKS